MNTPTTPNETDAVIEKLSALSERVSLLVNEGDRVDFSMSRDVTFTQGATNQLLMTFNIPRDGAYFATDLCLYPAVRRVAVASSDASDAVFCPTFWSTFVNNEAPTFLTGTISGDFRVRTTRNPLLMNQAAPVGSVFSTPMPAQRGTSYVGSMLFPIPEYLPGGSSLTVEFTPGFSLPWEPGDADADNDFAYEYQVTALLTGYKRVHAFK